MSRPENRVEHPFEQGVVAAHPISSIPQQRVAPDALLAAQPAGVAAGAPAAPRPWTVGRLLLLPAGAFLLYAGTMLGLGSVDGLVTGDAALTAFAHPAAALTGAVFAVVLLVAGARMVRGAVSR